MNVSISSSKSVSCSASIAVQLILILSLIGCSEGGTSDADPTLALLDNITIVGTASALNPSFSPGVFRYSVVSDAAASSVNVTVSAGESILISIEGQPVASGTTTRIDIKGGETIAIVTDNDSSGSSGSNSYEIQLLPADFPELTVSVSKDGVSADPLYVNLTTGLDSFYIVNLDNNGVPLFYRKLDTAGFDYKLHEVSNERSYNRRLKSVNEWGRLTAEIVLLDNNREESEVVTTVGLSHTGIHDFHVLPNNELLLLSYDGKVRDLSEFGLSTSELVEESVIQIIDRTSQEVRFEWRSLNEIPYDDQFYEPKRSEYAHINSVVVDFDGNLIASLRGTSNIIKIDRSSGQVLWKLGGKSNEFLFVNDPYTGTCGQHTVSRLDNGNILVFDNGQNCLPEDNRGKQTRIVEYKIDESSLTAELVWSYSHDALYTLFLGSAQRLSNGNTLIGWGRQPTSAQSTLLSEVDVDGNILFELIANSKEPVSTYRAYRFAESD